VHGVKVEMEADIQSQLQRQFLERLGLDKVPRPPADRQLQLRQVPDFLKQLMTVRSRMQMTSSSLDQSPFSALAISPSFGEPMFRLLICYVLLRSVDLSVFLLNLNRGL